MPTQAPDLWEQLASQNQAPAPANAAPTLSASAQSLSSGTDLWAQIAKENTSGTAADPWQQIAAQNQHSPETAQSSGSSFLHTIYNSITNAADNQLLTLPRIVRAGHDVLQGNWSAAQGDVRDLFLGTALPGMNPSSFEANPNPQIPADKGIWQNIKAGAQYPILGTFHRKGAGPIESEAEDWLTGQLNPLNAGIAVATAGTGLAESALTKAGVAASKASGIVHAVKTVANLGFLTQQGFGIGHGVNLIERDYDDWRKAEDPQDKSEALDQLKRDSTDVVLASLATGLASKGVESDLREAAARSSTGKAMAVPDYANAIHDFQAENQIGNGQAAQFAREGSKAVPNAIRREGITNYREAGGDLFDIVHRANETAADFSDPQRARRLHQGYQAAQNLTPDELALNNRITDVHADFLQRLRDIGALPEEQALTPPATTQPGVKVFHGTVAPNVNDIEDLDAAKHSMAKSVAGPAAYLTRDPAVAAQYVSNTPGAKVVAGVMHPDVKLLDARVPLPTDLAADYRLKFQGIVKQAFPNADPAAIFRQYAGKDLASPHLTYMDMLDAARQVIADAKGINADNLQLIPGLKDLQRVAVKRGYDGVSNVYPNSRDVIAIFPSDVTGLAFADVVKNASPSAKLTPHEAKIWQQQSAPRKLDPSTYISHHYDFEDESAENGQGGGLNRDFLRRRSFPSYFDAERAGFNPTNKDAVALTSDYIQRASATIARHNLAENLNQGFTDKGAPLTATGGIVTHNLVVPEVPADAALTKGDLARLQASGQLQELINSGRIYQQTGQTGQTAQPSIAYRFDGNGIRWAKVGDLPEVSIPARLTDPAEIEAEARQKAALQRDFIQAHSAPRYMWKFSDYQDSGLKTTRWIGNDSDGQPMFARVPVYVHPEIAPHLDNLLSQYAPKGIVGSMLKASSGVKSLLLSFSPFHWTTIANRALEAGGGHEILHPQPIDYFNLTHDQRAAIRDGLVAANTRPMYSGFVEEGLSSGGSHSLANRLINKIPGVEALKEKTGVNLNINDVLERGLFGPNGYITRLKFGMYDGLKDDIAKSNPRLTDEQAGRIAASQINNKFGGLNYTLLGRSMSGQSALRTILLAPDFLESTGRSLLDVAGPYGRPLLKRLVEFQVAKYLTVRLINKVFTGDFHPESGFAVVSPDGKKEYTMRDTLGDFLHFIKDPRDFAYNRLNPLLVRTPLETFYGVDQYGRRLSNDQRLTAAARQMTPISAQGPLSKVPGLSQVYGNQGVAEPSATDQFMKSLGVGAMNRLSPAETLALQRISAKSDTGSLEGSALAEHQEKFRLEDALRTANQSGDPWAIGAANLAIEDATNGDNAILSVTEARQMVKDAQLTRLQSIVKRLPLADALDVWNQAGIQERRQIADLIERKLVSARKEAGKKTPRAANLLLNQIATFEQMARP